MDLNNLKGIGEKTEKLFYAKILTKVLGINILLLYRQQMAFTAVKIIRWRHMATSKGGARYGNLSYAI